MAGVVVIVWGLSLAHAEELVPLDLKIPSPSFAPSFGDISGADLEPIQTKRDPFLAPKNVVNLAAGKNVTSSDARCSKENLAKIVDGNKGFDDENIVLLRKDMQWVQVDLGQECEVFAVVLWHGYNTVPKVFHKVSVVISDKEDFSSGNTTLFNNDKDANGPNKEYIETNFGKLIDAKGVKGRYLRFRSKGSNESALNEYTEIEVYGRPAK